jgi:23S rRNA G2445 N2-methylase RlmL
MKSLAWTNKGIVDVAASDIGSVCKCRPKIAGQLVFFAVKDYDELAKVCYLARSIRGAMAVLLECRLADLEDSLKKVRFPFGKNDSFAARLKSFDPGLASRDIESAVGGIVNDMTGAAVNLKSPKYTVLLVVQDSQCYLGIDFCVVDLGKRDYKLFSTRQSLKGNVAFSLLWFADFAPGKSLLDPFARDGMIGIEAALFARGLSPHFYHKEKFGFCRFLDVAKQFEGFDLIKGKCSGIRMYDSLFHNVSAMKKNAKIAGVDKFVSISMVDVDWVDIKIDEDSVDCIVSYPPQLTQNSDRKAVLKLYSELFHQAEFVLKKCSKMVLCMHSMEILDSVPTSLKRVRDIEVFQGMELLFIVVFQKL